MPAAYGPASCLHLLPMALALRLRRTLVAAVTSSSLLRPAASASLSQPLPLLLPGAAGGFQSRAAAAVRERGYSGVAEDKNSPDNGCDYKHWLIRMDFPDPQAHPRGDDRNLP